VFDSFVQLHRQTGPGPQGIGLGLTIAKSIVERHNGRITVQSSPGQGSSFSFTIPIYTEAKEIAAFIADHLFLAAASNNLLFVTLLKVDLSGHGHPRPRGLKNACCLKEVEQCVRRILRRNDDATLVAESEGMLVIVAETDQAGAGALTRRIDHAIREHFHGRIPIVLSSGTLDREDSVEEWIDTTKDMFAPLRTPNVPGRVLIIESDESVVHFASKEIELLHLNLTIESSPDAYSGCLLLGKLKPQFVILDVDMPDFDGEQFVRLVKSGPEGGKTKVVVLSSSLEKNEKLKLLGADECFVKPVNWQEFTLRAEELLQAEEYELDEQDQSTINT
jgi:PleD family two-component response regulator